jgi:hypothetical protein
MVYGTTKNQLKSYVEQKDGILNEFLPLPIQENKS